jgi:small subunit ribosomal protein S3
MTRRSTKLMRLENSLYTYGDKKESWNIRKINQVKNTNIKDLFELGSYFTCKHMSQKVNPISFRISNNKTWQSIWYSNYKYVGLEMGKLQLDLYIREYIQSVLKELKVLVDKIYIKEINNKYLVKIFIYEEGCQMKKNVLIKSHKASRYKPYIENIIKGSINPFFKNKTLNKSWFIDPYKVLNHIENQLNKHFNESIHLSIVYKQDVGDSASLLGHFLTNELEKPNRNFRRVLKDSLKQIKNNDKIRGLRINCSGRLGRAPMAKMEWFRYGSIPLTKISAKVDYVQLTGKTKYGSFGIKVWLYAY